MRRSQEVLMHALRTRWVAPLVWLACAVAAGCGGNSSASTDETAPEAGDDGQPRASLDAGVGHDAARTPRDAADDLAENEDGGHRDSAVDAREEDSEREDAGSLDAAGSGDSGAEDSSEADSNPSSLIDSGAPDAPSLDGASEASPPDASVDAEPDGSVLGCAVGSACLLDGGNGICVGAQCQPCVDTIDDVACTTAYASFMTPFVCDMGSCLPGDCHSNADCADGVCGLIAPRECACVPVAEACTSASQCCDGECNEGVCGPPGCPSDGSACGDCIASQCCAQAAGCLDDPTCTEALECLSSCAESGSESMQQCFVDCGSVASSIEPELCISASCGGSCL